MSNTFDPTPDDFDPDAPAGVSRADWRSYRFDMDAMPTDLPTDAEIAAMFEELGEADPFK
jgi:N-acyl-D-aspartate/D-glutamate deacylase